MPAQLTPGEEWHWITTPDGLSLWIGWGIEKNATLIRTRNISFHQVALALAETGIDELAHDTRTGHAHRNQYLLNVTINGYTFTSPCKMTASAQNEPCLFLKTCYANRKATRAQARRHPSA